MKILCSKLLLLAYIYVNKIVCEVLVMQKKTCNKVSNDFTDLWSRKNEKDVMKGAVYLFIQLLILQRH